MGRRSREINIFSMSALDLFASALGSFILLAVVMLPYFPNTGDSPVLIEAVKAQLTDAEEDLEEAERATAAAEAQRDAATAAQARAEAAAEAAAKRAAAAEAKAKAKTPTPKPQGGRRLPALDVVVAIDTTGSMGTQVNGMKRDIESLISILMELSEDPALGIIDFKDRCFGARSLRSYRLRKLGPSSIPALRRFAQQTVLGPPSGLSSAQRQCNSGEGSGPELLDGALRDALSHDWRPSSSIRMIIIVTDNVAYPEKVQQTYADAAKFRSQGGQVSVSFAGRSTLAPTLKQLADRGGGDFVLGSSFIGTVIVTLLK